MTSLKDPAASDRGIASDSIRLNAAPSSSSVPSKGARLPALDGLRGIAAFMVLQTHFVGLFAQLDAHTWSRRLMDTSGKLGLYGVDVFFVLSGFVLALATAQSGLNRTKLPLFLFRRFVRLAPPYWMSIALMLLVLKAQSMFGRGHVEQVSCVQLVAHIFYLQDLLRIGSINVVYWTLCLEIQFYIVFALGVVAFKRIDGLSRSIALAVLMTSYVVSLAFDLYQSQFPMLLGTFVLRWHEFALGVVAWLLLRQADIQGRAIAVGVTLLGIAIGLLFKSGSVLVSVGTFLFIVAMGRREQLGNLLTQSPVQYLGKISYSLYLVHVPVLFLCLALRARVLPGNELVSWIFFVVAVCLSILTAHAIYICAERPSIAFSKRLKANVS